MLTSEHANAGEAAENSAKGVTGESGGALALTRELRELIHDQLRLVTLESRLAAQSLMTMVAAAVGFGVLLVSAWLGLMGAAVLTLIGFGLVPSIAILVVAALNLMVSPVPYGLIRRKIRRLGFPATLRTLKPAFARGSAANAR